MNDPHYLRYFPALSAENHVTTSIATPQYNCIAWAAGDETRWWEPDFPDELGYYWPKVATSGMAIFCLIEAFEAIGYHICGDGGLEAEVRKVALYADAALIWTHAARQLESGKWSSKLGISEDIQHDAPENVVSEAYGSVYCFMAKIV